MQIGWTYDFSRQPLHLGGRQLGGSRLCVFTEPSGGGVGGTAATLDSRSRRRRQGGCGWRRRVRRSGAGREAEGSQDWAWSWPPGAGEAPTQGN